MGIFHTQYTVNIPRRHRSDLGIGCSYPDGECLHRAVMLNRNCPLETHEICTAESVKYLLCRGPHSGHILQAVIDQVLHVWPGGTSIVLNVINWMALGE